MTPPLITVEQYTDRLGHTLDAAEQAQAAALIGDASALVRLEAGEDFLDEQGELADVPDAIVGVVYAMVRRAIENPRALTGETLGDYTWQSGGSSSTGIYLMRAEKRTVRQAVGKLSAGSVQLEGDLPVRGFVSLESLVTDP